MHRQVELLYALVLPTVHLAVKPDLKARGHRRSSRSLVEGLLLRPCQASPTPPLEHLWDLGACGQ